MLQVQQDAYSVAAQEDRCGPREKLVIPAQLRVSGHRGIQSVVHDLSISGFSAASVNRMYPGQICWLTIQGLQGLQAEVVWWENSIVGCAFSELLSPVVHENLLATYSKTAEFRTAC